MKRVRLHMCPDGTLGFPNDGCSAEAQAHTAECLCDRCNPDDIHGCLNAEAHAFGDPSEPHPTSPDVGRGSVLGALAVLDERQADYADPRINFRRIADLWGVILDAPVTPKDVALCMIALKITREMHRHKPDNLDDIIGYAECARRIAEEGNGE